MTYAYGVLDTFYRYDMSLEEAVELGKDPVIQAAKQSTTQPTGTLAAVVSCASTTSTRTAGLKKLQETMSTNCTMSTWRRRAFRPTTRGASCEGVIMLDRRLCDDG